MDSKPLKLGGLYRHYKGNLYRVHQVVRHSENLEELVLYETLYDNNMGQWWVRPRSLFSGTVTVDGVTQARFELVEEETSEAEARTQE